MFCKFCGNRIDDNSVFCSVCGKRLTSEESSSKPEVTVNSEVYTNEEEIIIEKPTENAVRPPKSVTFLQAIKSLYVNYTNFSGRAVKSEYWYVCLYNLIIQLSLWVLPLPDAVGLVWSIIHAIPGLALSIRRLHDTGRSGNYVWISFIPIAGPFIFIYFMTCDSDYDNQYGLSHYTTISTTVDKKEFEGYSATTKSANHTWTCTCGAKISVTPCPFCGREYVVSVNNENDLRNHFISEIQNETKSENTIEFYKKYIECVDSVDTAVVLDDLKYILANCFDFVDTKKAELVISSCEKKLTEMGLKRCLGCGEFLPISENHCSCGYTF